MNIEKFTFFEKLPKNVQTRILLNVDDINVVKKIKNKNLLESVELAMAKKFENKTIYELIVAFHLFETKSVLDKLEKVISKKLKTLKYTDLINVAELVYLSRMNVFKKEIDGLLAEKFNVSEFLSVKYREKMFKSNYVKNTLKNNMQYVINEENEFPLSNLINLSTKAKINGNKDKSKVLLQIFLERGRL